MITDIAPKVIRRSSYRGTIDVFRSKADSQFYFTTVSNNRKKIAQSEGYKDKQSAVRTIDALFSTGWRSTFGPLPTDKIKPWRLRHLDDHDNVIRTEWVY